MGSTSLQRVLFLKSQLDSAKQSIQLPENNNEFNRLFQQFEINYRFFVEKMSEIDESEMLESLDKNLQSTKQSFLLLFPFNRGDYQQNRFRPSATNLTKHACLEDQISRVTKQFIETIEDQQLCPALLQAYRERHINQILYHHGVIGHYQTGERSYTGRTIYDKYTHPPKGATIIKFAMVSLVFTSLSVAFFATAALLGLSGGWIIAATALFGAAVAYMGGLLYGIVNDIFAVKANLPYFLLGHQASQYSYFSSNDPLVQATGWGVIAAQPIAIIAAVVFGVAIFSTMMASTAPVLTFMLPLMLLVVPLFAVCANSYAKRCANNYITNGFNMNSLPNHLKSQLIRALNLEPTDQSVDLDKINFDLPGLRLFILNLELLNPYQLDGLALMSSSKQAKANWLANSDRNLLGYAVTPLLAVASLILMLTLTSAPSVLFSPLLSIVIPVVSATVAITVLASLFAYTLVNKDKQVDNRYKLFTDLGAGEKKMDELYLTEEQQQSYRVTING